MNNNLDAMIENLEYIESQIAELQKPIAEQVFELQKQANELNDKIKVEAYKAAAPELQQNDYGCGTSNFETANFKIKTVVSKKVTWNDKELRNVEDQIKTAGQDPEVYITYKRSVSETAFKKFPEEIQKAFEPARSVEPSKPVISWERK